MNSLACPLSLRLSSPDGAVSLHSDLEGKSSRVLYDLRPGLYDLDVRVSEACPEVDGEYMKRYRVSAKDEKVGILPLSLLLLLLLLLPLCTVVAVVIVIFWLLMSPLMLLLPFSLVLF